MIIQNRSFGTYSIDKNGNFSVGAEWRLRQEAPEEGAAALYEAARVWAGNVGEPFRVPTPEGGFTLSEELKVSSVSFKELEGGGLVVAYQAEPATGPELLGEVTEKIDRDGVRTRSASWSVPLVSARPGESGGTGAAGLRRAGGIFALARSRNGAGLGGRSVRVRKLRNQNEPAWATGGGYGFRAGSQHPSTRRHHRFSKRGRGAAEECEIFRHRCGTRNIPQEVSARLPGGVGRRTLLLRQDRHVALRSDRQ